MYLILPEKIKKPIKVKPLVNKMDMCFLLNDSKQEKILNKELKNLINHLYNTNNEPQISLLSEIMPLKEIKPLIQTKDWKNIYMDKLKMLTKLPPIRESDNWKNEYDRIIKPRYFSNINKALGRKKNIKYIRVLKLNNKALKEIPKEIYELRSLQVLELNSNYIKEIPKGISKLIHLIRLEVSDNLLDDIPDELNNLIRLKTFKFSM